MSDDSPLARLRRTALALPDTSEKVSHGQPTFFVAGKQFAQFRDDHHGDGRTIVCIRVGDPDEQAMLLDAAPEIYSKPAYLPAWLGMSLTGDAVDGALIEDRVARSWELAAPARLLEAGGR